MHGFLNIDKPSGPTSHDVVAQLRRITRQRRIGHAGTLDPAATGVLVVALGQATRLIEYVQDQTHKRYQAVVQLGRTTDTDDAEGTLVGEAAVPDVTAEQLQALLHEFEGEVLQVPPMYSALHHEGQRLHELARAGVTVERAARPVQIEWITVLHWATPLLTLDVRCGKGVYIRSLARDIGERLGCGAHLSALRRTEVGRFHVDASVALELLAAQPHQLAERLLPPETAVADWLRLDGDADTERLLRNGMPIPRRADAMRARAHASNGSLLALLRADGPFWKPEKVFVWS